MEEMEILKKLETVKAPPDFEQKVMAQLSLRRRHLHRRRVGLRLSPAGAFALLLVGFILFNVLVLEKRRPLSVSRSEGPGGDIVAAGEISGPGKAFPIIETLDYSLEVRNRSQEPEAIYLLEQVSDKALQGVRF